MPIPSHLESYKPRQAQKLTHAFLTAANAIARLHDVADEIKADLRAAGLKGELVEAHLAILRKDLEAAFEL